MKVEAIRLHLSSWGWSSRRRWDRATRTARNTVRGRRAGFRWWRAWWSTERGRHLHRHLTSSHTCRSPRWTANCVVTAAVLVAEIGKSPHIAKTNSRPHTGEDELELTAPLRCKELYLALRIVRSYFALKPIVNSYTPLLASFPPCFSSSTRRVSMYSVISSGFSRVTSSRSCWNAGLSSSAIFTHDTKI